ncbi:MAG: cupin domain-containing protein [Pseudobdellovibrio sp.]
MIKKPDFIKNINELISNESFSYPGDAETFGIGAAVGRKLGLSRIGINYEILRPGDRSSWPHAHSHDEEFIFILEGNPDLWIDGNLHPLKPGDCVGFVPGTGYAHTLINNSDKDVRAIVVGDSGHAEDKIFYPLHPARNEDCKKEGWFWENHLQHEQGPHDGKSNLKRNL